MHYTLHSIPKTALPNSPGMSAEERGERVISALTALFQKHHMRADLRLGRIHGKLVRNAVEGTVFSSGHQFSAQFRANTSSSSERVSIDAMEMRAEDLEELAGFTRGFLEVLRDPQFQTILSMP